MADEFNRPEFWEKSRLFNEMVKRQRTPEQNERRFPEGYPLGRSMFAGPWGGGFDDDEKWYRYSQTGETPWDEPLLFDRYMVKPGGRSGTIMQGKEPSKESPLVNLGVEMHQRPSLNRAPGQSGPRTQVIQHVDKTNPISYHDPASKALFIEKYGQDAWDRIKDPSEDLEHPEYASPPDSEEKGFSWSRDVPLGYARRNTGEVFVRDYGDDEAPLNYGVIAMHEQEHAGPQSDDRFHSTNRWGKGADYTRNPRRAAVEMGPTMGDIVNTAATYRATHGEPLDMDVKFPAGTVQNPDTMAQWAYEHGYNQPGGPSMSDLIFGTPEGRKWLKVHAGEKPMKEPFRR
jgi:hypothetical protein